MQASSHIAFKEWAVICAALAQGEQTLILRKGGIHEGRDGFQVGHREFWLFPTYEHEAQSGLIESAHPLLESTSSERPPAGTVRITLYAEVAEVLEIRELAAALNLAGQHIWSPRTIEARFNYHRPGLFLMPVRVYQLPRALELADSPHFAGCRSWVELPCDLRTGGLRPVLSDEEFARRLDMIRRAAAPVRLA